MKATWNGRVVAASDDTVVIEGNHYFPPTSVNKEYIEQSDTHTVCAWKGRASYYTLVVDGRRNPDAAWYYPEPTRDAQHIKDYVAFRHGVDISA